MHTLNKIKNICRTTRNTYIFNMYVHDTFKLKFCGRRQNATNESENPTR